MTEDGSNPPTDDTPSPAPPSVTEKPGVEAASDTPSATTTTSPRETEVTGVTRPFGVYSSQERIRLSVFDPLPAEVEAPAPTPTKLGGAVTQKNGVKYYAPPPSGEHQLRDLTDVDDRPATTPSRGVPAVDPTREVSSSRPRPTLRSKSYKTQSTLAAAPEANWWRTAAIVIGVITAVVSLGAKLREIKDSRGLKLMEPIPGVVAVWGGENENAVVFAYVQRVALDIARAAHLKSLYVHIANDATVQVLPLPGAQVLVTTGALRRLGSEAQLAGVLAHAAAHIRRGDLERRFVETGEVETDLVKRAIQAGATEYALLDEVELDPVVAKILVDAGYPSGGFADAFPLLGPQGGTVSDFFVAHPQTPARLKAQRAVNPDGRVGENEYDRQVLDHIGRTQKPVVPSVAPKAAPPAPPPEVPLARPLAPPPRKVMR